MSDHDTPRSLLDPAFDLADLYVFPSPEQPGRLVLVLNLCPGARHGARFSDGATYRFKVRPASVPTDGRRSSFDVGSDERMIRFTFAPPRTANGQGTVQEGTCFLPDGSSAAFVVDGQQNSDSGSTRIFAGLRGDSSFINIPGYTVTAAAGHVEFPEPAINVTEGSNVLSIVMELDPGPVFGWSPGTLLAVAGEVLTDGKFPLRVERIGRAVLKNMYLAQYGADTVNRDLDLRGLFNQEDPFDLGRAYVGAYRARLNANLHFLDGLDGKVDWPVQPDGAHPLTELLLGDYIVVDPAKPYDEHTYLEIERALLAGRQHQTSGGRPINDDATDILATLVFTAGIGPAIDDGVDGATAPASRMFPYLASPNPDPPAIGARPLFPSKLEDQLALVRAASPATSSS
jgi:hypothetical protein